MLDILEKIKKIEALIRGAQTEGEKNAAIAARERVLSKVPAMEPKKELKEYSLHMQDAWHKKLLLAICRKHNVRPYRYHRQKHTTVMVRIDPDFLNNVVWKEFLQYSVLLEALVSEITDDLIAKIHRHEDEDVVSENLQLGQ